MRVTSSMSTYITHSSPPIGCTGETIAWTRWGNTTEEEHGAPYYHIHVKFELYLVCGEADKV
jgi:hypothetical protein